MYEPFTEGVCTTFSWTKNLLDENTSMTLTMCNSCSLGFWYRKAEWQSRRVVRVLDLKFRGPKLNPRLTAGFHGGKTFCASICASLIAGSRRDFLCVDCVCLLLEFWVKCTRCERLLPVKHFYLTCLLFFRRLKITLDSEPMLKEKRIIPSVWGGKRRVFFLIVHPINLWVDFARLN